MSKKKKNKNNNSDSNFKLIINLIKELLKTPRGRGILFFVGFFIFFLTVILIVRFADGGEVIGSGYESGTPYSYSISNIVNDNYKFNYEVEIDGNKIVYSGERYNNDIELFSYFDGVSTLNYYRNLDNYLVDNNGIWVKSNNPYLYSSFMDIEKISELLSVSTYISKTEYDSGKKVYNFQFSTATVIDIFEGIEIDIDDFPNEISLSTDNDGNTNEIRFKLDSYCKYNKLCNGNMEIYLTYDDYGEIEEIANPVV